MKFFGGDAYIGFTGNVSPWLNVYDFSTGGGGSWGSKLANPAALFESAAAFAVSKLNKFIAIGGQTNALPGSAFYRFVHAPGMAVLGGAEIGVADAETMMTGPSGAWEQISLSFTPTAKGFVTIRVFANAVGTATGKAFFDDFSVA
jgi:hypothetical protein